MSRNTSGLIPFKKGQSGNPEGAKKKWSTMLKDIPPEAKAEILGVLYHASTLGVDEARENLKEHTNGKYGLIYQIVLRGLAGKNGWQVLNDILDRLFGKARQTAEVTHKGGTQIIVSAPDKNTAEDIGKL